MAFKDLNSRDAIQKALDEYKSIGQERFLDKYGFAKSKDYFIEYDGDFYDSKPIIGAAHGYQFGSPLTANDFSGGKDTVEKKLKELGFKVTYQSASRNPTWTDEEMILALDFYIKHRSSIPSNGSDEINALSQELQAIQTSYGTEVSGNLRNSNGVYLRMMNYRAVDPEYSGKGMTAGIKKCQPYWDKFSENWDELHKSAETIRNKIDLSDDNKPITELHADSTEGKLSYGPKPRVEGYTIDRADLSNTPASTYVAQFGNTNIFKVGYTQDPNQRLQDFNKHIPTHEKPELQNWSMCLIQRWDEGNKAWEMEQTLLNKHLKNYRSEGERVVCSKQDIEDAWKRYLIEKNR